MARKASGKKIRPSSRDASKGVIRKHQKIRTKIKVEQANKESFLISELNKREHTNKRAPALESLKVMDLIEDRKKDKSMQKKIEEQKQSTNKNIVEQLEMISGFSL
ncbi:LAQU0S15e00210g1_1 [Lachancea quebecensis]|uniref:LAQU0S15e00210g1_1 n=1 Tax=Lachancea quebecensis TaxID=1654605 RepID=A0A0P1KVR2_9SACH|nr:LAQU0S15e00210g1_1 [Lachancea quebecensis]